MASTSATKPSEETRDWLKMPDDIMGGMILERLGAVEILINTQKVCTTWRKICKDPAMWKVIDMTQDFDQCDTTVYKGLTKQAVDRSRGELIDISLNAYCTRDLLDYISQCSSKLNSLRLTFGPQMISLNLIPALRRLPHLETLHLFDLILIIEDIEVIAQTCSQLKSFKMGLVLLEFDGSSPLAIANNMHALRHLQLAGIMISDDGLQAILDGCQHLESLDLHGCLYDALDENLLNLCRERIDDFKSPNIPVEAVDEPVDQLEPVDQVDQDP